MKAKQILSVTGHGEKKKLQIIEENLRLLLAEDVADLPVVVISVAGAYRTGKSFLLNSMVRYLKAPDKSHWLDNKCEGFSWKGGCEPHTNGLTMSSPIHITLPSGEKGVLLLMDTQGLFDRNSGVSDLVNIFSLSTLISSVQVYNVMHDLKSNELEYLQLFAEVGRLVSDTTEGKPFQDLVFLVRDWQHKQDYPLGSQGGTDLMNQRLNSASESTHKQREQLKKCFANVSGFLLPYPGQTVAESPTFDGDAKDMDSEFSNTLGDFMATVLLPDNLTVKKTGD